MSFVGVCQCVGPLELDLKLKLLISNWIKGWACGRILYREIWATRLWGVA